MPIPFEEAIYLRQHLTRYYVLEFIVGPVYVGYKTALLKIYEK